MRPGKKETLATKQIAPETRLTIQEAKKRVLDPKKQVKPPKMSQLENAVYVFQFRLT